MSFRIHPLIIIAVVGAAATFGCASDKSSRSTTETNAMVSPDQGGLERRPTIHIRGIRAGHDIFGRRIFAVGKEQFATLPEFKVLVASLTPGSIVVWDSGCIKYETIPLLESDMTIAAFKEYCKKHGVDFRFICGY